MTIQNTPQTDQSSGIKRPFKAALMSAFIMPGSGQMWLGNKWQGMGFMAVSLGCVLVLMNFAIERAQVISEKILAGEVPLEYSAIYAQITQAPEGDAAQVAAWITWIFVANWLTSIVTAYVAGTKTDDRKISGKNSSDK
ncbi:hypothetical protein [Shewanella glacialimarina]|jgi:hypothetical protein|uniref:hypothetical protein n=1 Tax=Shewanella glacialimarina TaxID=2590884 RepID=UPI001CF8935C|nr:hypothetical protein [Shewanella glacialimarina]UCX06179.1 hypothetical protein FJ709_17765 [Shewanella glacialimarina]